MDFKFKIMKTEEVLTPFEADIIAKYGGGKQFPEVFYGGKKIPFFKYQLAVHKYELGLNARGIKPNRAFRLANYKKYYGLKGNSGKRVLEEFMDKIWNVFHDNSDQDGKV